MDAEVQVRVNLLKKELESWRPFVEAMREDDRRVAREMFEGCWRYVEAIEASNKRYLVEPLFLTLLLSQEKKIRILEQELGALLLEIQVWKSEAGY